jgi:hypothetical protein
VETESFAARDTTLAQAEVYYRPGPWMFGTEYFVQKADALVAEVVDATDASPPAAPDDRSAPCVRRVRCLATRSG